MYFFKTIFIVLSILCTSCSKEDFNGDIVTEGMTTTESGISEKQTKIFTGGIRLLTESEDWAAAQNSGVDTNTFITKATFDEDTGIDMPTTFKPVGDFIFNGKSYVILYEGETSVSSKCLINATFTFSDGEGYEYSLPIYNISLSPGNLTTIAGQHLTGKVMFSITINPEFNGSY